MTNRKEKEKTLKVLFASPEVMPFAGTGGLGEVAGSLPKAVNELYSAAPKVSMECRVIMPLYGSVKEEFRSRMKFLGHIDIPVAWRNQYMGIFQLEYEGVIYYFVDNEYYFKRDGLYGFGDDCERFAYFSRAVLESSKLTGFIPDIVHANDWQTALVPVFSKTLCKGLCNGDDVKTVFTVHNVEYQGKYGKEQLDDCIGLDKKDNDILCFEDHINLMKGAIYSCDRFTTVSPTYARELTYPVSAFGLDGVIRSNTHKMTGILNGINYSAYDPKEDRAIAETFSAEDMSGKAACKKALQKELGLPRSQAPLAAMITRLVAPKGVDLVVEMMDGLLEQTDLQFVLLGTGDKSYEEWFRGLQSRHPDQVRSLIEFDTAKAHRIYAGADIFLMPSRSEACGLAQMIACRYGTAPIVRLTGGLADSIKEWDGQNGNGFTFYDFNAQELYFAVTRALGLYKDRAAWEELTKHIMGIDFSWNRSARDYYKMYTEMA